jgi:glucose-1-phosphate thymidylyltransferase
VRTVHRAVCAGLPNSVLEEIGFENGWIERDQLLEAAKRYGKSPYGMHLRDVAERRIISRPRD